MSQPAIETGTEKPALPADDGPLMTELLILPDGRVLVHSLTPAFAELLRELNPDCAEIASRLKQK